jgi:hypothetical protein
MGLAAVKLKLLQQEALEIQEGTLFALDDTVSHSVLMSMGIELEEQQSVIDYRGYTMTNTASAFRRRLRSDVGQHATDNQLANVQGRKNTLQRKIDSWTAIQVLYVPGLAMLRRHHNGLSEEQPQNASLWLPSAISGRVSCDLRLYSHEWDLRYAQANDALREVRRNLQLRAHLFKYKDRFSTGQQANTRANATISRVQRYINSSAARYRSARKALLSLAAHLSKGDSWKLSLLELRDEDIRGMTVGEEGETEGRRSLSWIWKSFGTASDSEDENLQECMFSMLTAHHHNTHVPEGLRVEWCKGRARALRWTEEVQLLMEEMRRVLVFLEWKAAFWEERASILDTAPDESGAQHHETGRKPSTRWR